MKRFCLSVILASTIIASMTKAPTMAATTNVASGATVSLEGGPFFITGQGSGSNEVVSASTIVDGIFLPRNRDRDRGTVWWDSVSTSSQYIRIDLQTTAVIESLIVQADDNDAYRVYYLDPESLTWKLAWDVPNYDTYGWGMQTRPNPAADREAHNLDHAIVTNALKIEGVLADSDGQFAVSEAQAYGRWVTPPPSIQHTLTIKTTPGGSVTSPGQGQFPYAEGSMVPIEATAQGLLGQFAGWTGSAVDQGKVANPQAAKTTVLVDGDYLLQANFQGVLEVWRTTYTNGFQSTIGREWSRTNADVTPAGQQRFLGQFGNDAVTLVLQNLPQHVQVRVSFDLLVIRSWDGVDPSSGPDLWSSSIHSGPTLMRTTFDNHHFKPQVNTHRQSYPRDYPYGSSMPQTEAAERNTLGYYCYVKEVAMDVKCDAVYRLTFTFDHSDLTLGIDFWASGLEDRSNESWGLDNVKVELAQTIIGSPIPPDSPPSSPENIEASHPSPPDGASNVVSPVLGWVSDPAATFHDVGFGATPALKTFVRQMRTTFMVPFAYSPQTTYYWRVDEVKTQGSGESVSMGILWSFTTAGLKAHSPYPLDQLVWRPSQVRLSWGSGVTAAFHDVYIGTQRTLGAQNRVGRVTQADYLYPQSLSPGTTYYWRIDEVEADGKTIHSGPVWSFKTPSAIIVDDDAPGDPGPRDPARSDPQENGTAQHPYDSIQEAIDKSPSPGVILVRDGLYTDRDWAWTGIHFKGKRITLRSEHGSSQCIIDCQGKGRGFTFDQGEGNDSILEGFTITHGYCGESGGAIQCSAGTSPQIVNCRIIENTANEYGAGIFLTGASPMITGCVLSGNQVTGPQGCGGIYCLGNSEPTLIDTEISGNTGAGIFSGTPGKRIYLDGNVKLSANDLVGAGTILLGNGACLEAADCRISHSIAGPGRIRIPPGSTATIDGSHVVVDLSGEGTIECAGRLRITGATLKGAYVRVRAAGVLLDEAATVEGNTFRLDDPSGISELEVLGTINSFKSNTIYATNDDCLKINPKDFLAQAPRENLIQVTLVGGHVFEVRGKDEQASPPDNESCLVTGKECLTYFDLTRWSINSMTLRQGASVSLTNRSQDQRGLLIREAIYVKTLVLEPNSVLNLASNRLYCENLVQDPTARIVNEPLLAWSLGQVDFSDPNGLTSQIQQNSFQAPDDSQYTRVHVEQVVGFNPDPTGMMRMRNLKDLDPGSATHDKLITARAKVAFNRCYESSVLVRFSYLFESSAPGLELVAYLSDMPDLLNRDDPLRARHYREISRVMPPPEGYPGAIGSGRLAVFEERASTAGMNLTNGTWVELELMEAQVQANAAVSRDGIQLASAGEEGGSASIGGIGPEIHCEGFCLDLNLSRTADEEDAWLVYVASGRPVVLGDGGRGIANCVDGVFSSDRYVDYYDTCSWDWALQHQDRVRCGNSPLVPFSDGGFGGAGSTYPVSNASVLGLRLSGLDPLPEGLLILGKCQTDLISDSLCFLNGDLALAVDYRLPGLPLRCSIRIVLNPAKQICLMNSEQGVLQLDSSVKSLIPPGKVNITNDPRYHHAATVYVGIQTQDSKCFGRPIFDVAFGPDADVYVVPVVVHPLDQEAYLAAARLKPKSGSNPPYQLVQLYDDPPPAAESQLRNCLREIEVDSAGNAYVLNVHRLNENCILWKYAPNGTVLGLINLMDPNGLVQVEDPVALHISRDGKLLYIASAQRHPGHPDSTVLYGLFTEDFSSVRAITIADMQQVTSLTEARNGTLWVAGFNTPDAPTAESYAWPCLAKVDLTDKNVTATCICGPGGPNLTLPVSMVWTGEMK